MNRTHWKATLGAALLGLCSFAAYAQSTTPAPADDAQGAPHNQWRHGRDMGQGNEDREFGMLIRCLSLTTDQQTGVKALLDQEITQMRALRTSPPTDESPAPGIPEARQARRAQMTQIHEETETKISALLDENQKKTYSEMIAQRKAAIARRQAR